jgi:hypothetical protein
VQLTISKGPQWLVFAQAPPNSSNWETYLVAQSIHRGYIMAELVDPQGQPIRMLPIPLGLGPEMIPSTASIELHEGEAVGSITLRP